MCRLLSTFPGRARRCGFPAARVRCYATVAESSSLRTALFFPGHGVQRVGMTSAWLEAYPSTVRPFLEETDEILKYPLSKIIAQGPVNKLNETENAQPGVMATSIMILRVLEKEYAFKTDEKIDVTLGHSLGEYAALVVAGHLDYPFALRMVRRRAEIMAECTRKASKESGESYGMMALVCEPDRLESLLATIHQFLEPGAGSKTDSHEVAAIDQVLIANINSKNQIVLSGSFDRIKQLLVQIREFGGHDPRAVEIKSNSPFHSPIMIPAMEYMRKTLRDGPVNFPAKMPCISNVSGLPFKSKDDLKDLLSRQAVETVRWWDSIKYLDQTAKVKRWLGVGPGKVGRNLVGKEVGRSFAKGGGVWAISDPREVEPTLRALEETEAEDISAI
jgi:[acyl-carrier-protein] S-malonyltransferase